MAESLTCVSRSRAERRSIERRVRRDGRVLARCWDDAMDALFVINLSDIEGLMASDELSFMDALEDLQVTRCPICNAQPITSVPKGGMN